MDVYLVCGWIWDNESCDTTDLGIIKIYDDFYSAVDWIKSEYKNVIEDLDTISKITENFNPSTVDKSIYLMDIISNKIELHYKIKKNTLVITETEEIETFLRMNV
jgi:hypothetical protein